MRTVSKLAGFSIVAALLFFGGCTSTKSGNGEVTEEPSANAPSGESSGARAQPSQPVRPGVPEGLAAATFAGGCFWCMEPPFEKLDGVESVVSGYCGGAEKDPAYERVASGKTGHAESVQIVYDPEVVGYEKLLDVYWRNIDPTDDAGQFVDRGAQYRPVIFYHSAEQKELAEASKRALADSGRFDEPIVVEIVPASRFWKAEMYHQDFYKKSPERYHSYRRGSGRDPFLQRVWGESGDDN